MNYSRNLHSNNQVIDVGSKNKVSLSCLVTCFCGSEAFPLLFLFRFFSCFCLLPFCMMATGDDAITLHNPLPRPDSRLIDEEEGIISYAVAPEVSTESALSVEDSYCIVGRFLTTKRVDFDAMRHLMATLWQPGKGLYVQELESNHFLFQFYHEVDVRRMMKRSPWTFNNSLLIFHRLLPGEDPRTVSLNSVDMWVQLHDIPIGFKTSQVCQDLGNHIGTFVEADPKNFLGLWRDFLRIRSEWMFQHL